MDLRLGEVYERLAAEAANVVAYAVDRDADYRARDVRYDAGGATFECATAAGAVEVSSTTSLSAMVSDASRAWPLTPSVTCTRNT